MDEKSKVGGRRGDSMASEVRRRYWGGPRSLSGETHPRTGLLSDLILGSQDGLVNVLGIILGVAAASGNVRLILAGGLAATFAESVSMAAVAYTSTLARHEHYVSEAAREEREMRDLPETEREEVRQVFRRWGFEGKELEELVTRIASRPKAWLEFMMAHELSLAPVERVQARRSAVTVGTAAVLGSLIPLAPFAFVGTNVLLGVVASLMASTVVLFYIGWYKARTTVGRPGLGGLQMALIGMAAGLAGFAIGLLFGGI